MNSNEISIEESTLDNSLTIENERTSMTLLKTDGAYQVNMHIDKTLEPYFIVTETYPDSMDVGVLKDAFDIPILTFYDKDKNLCLTVGYDDSREFIIFFEMQDLNNCDIKQIPNDITMNIDRSDIHIQVLEAIIAFIKSARNKRKEGNLDEFKLDRIEYQRQSRL